MCEAVYVREHVCECEGCVRFGVCVSVCMHLCMCFVLGPVIYCLCECVFLRV